MQTCRCGGHFVVRGEGPAAQPASLRVATPRVPEMRARAAAVFRRQHGPALRKGPGGGFEGPIASYSSQGFVRGAQRPRTRPRTLRTLDPLGPFLQKRLTHSESVWYTSGCDRGATDGRAGSRLGQPGPPGGHVALPKPMRTRACPIALRLLALAMLCQIAVSGCGDSSSVPDAARDRRPVAGDHARHQHPAPGAHGRSIFSAPTDG